MALKFGHHTAVDRAIMVDLHDLSALAMKLNLDVVT